MISVSRFGPLMARLFATKKGKTPKETPRPSLNFDIEKVKKDMEGSVKSFEANLKKISIGRGDPRVFDNVYVPAKHANLSAIAQITPKNANEIVIKPFDLQDIDAIFAALGLSDIKMQFRKEGTSFISVSIPKPSQEYRNELIRQARDYSEDTKQSIRKKRQSSLQSLKDVKDVGEDDIKQIKTEVQNVTDSFTQTIEKILKEKEKSLNI